ncbi:RNA polymerase sigma factor [Actinophytocola xinjiangensis]|nr:sigma-70 family RNA polymerase sigma factor [Actinophytocola xinjiangensis]
MITDSDLTLRLAAGDLRMWPEFVRRHTALLWAVARSYRLNHSDAADVVQTTWVRLAENLPHLTNPDRLQAWLVTTTRRESQRQRVRRAREDPVGSVDVVSLEPRNARDQAFQAAFEALPVRCRAMLALQVNAPELTYAQLAAALEMQAGSVGRTKSRCLEHLRSLVEKQAELAESA